MEETAAEAAAEVAEDEDDEKEAKNVIKRSSKYTIVNQLKASVIKIPKNM